MKPPPLPPRAHAESEIVRLVWLAIFISVFSFLYYYRQGEVLLYGDAVAHINIARRIFDSRTPGLLQLGTVWLPLPHLLILPFIVSSNMWQSGAGGSIPSMAAFVLGTLGIFRLVRTTVGSEKNLEKATAPGIPQIINGKWAAWIAAILYAANPNLIYMQSTAMGESLYLAFFIWTVAYFGEFTKGTPKALSKSALCLFAACLTRYDGWFLAALLIASVLLLEFRSPTQTKNSKLPIRPRSQIAQFLLIAAAAPVLWLGYNAAVYRNPVEFANGPYSAKSIEQKTATVNPAKGNLFAAGSYFVKAAELNVAESTWLGRFWVALALAGTVSTCRSARGRLLLFLWIPLPFYALSIAFGSVPIFVPPWWPFAQYNVRYGLQLLPAFAVFVPLGISTLFREAANVPQVVASWRQWLSPAAALATLLLVAASYAAIWRADPICFREASINMKGAVALDRQLGEWLKSLPANSTLLMYLGEHVGALERAGIPLRRTINEGNHRVWKSPYDPEGPWERALADPAAWADFVIGFEGDPVWNAARAHHLSALVEIHTTGQPSAVIFQGKINTPASAR